MGTIYVDVEVANLQNPSATRKVRTLVDTGATISKIPEAILAQIGVEPVERRRFRLADGRVVTRRVGIVYLRFAGHVVACHVSFGRRGEKALLGLTALETAGLAADPARRRLVEEDLLMMSELVV